MNDSQRALNASRPTISVSRPIELLAPAKDLACGMAAIDHGADAVYIGAPQFGARAAAGNSVDDIAQLCRYAHQYEARVYATVNTIIYNEELDAASRLIDALINAGVDAVLVQDMALVNIIGGRMAMHASTQTDNRTPEKVKWLRAQGFRRIVLARELSAREIAAIHAAEPAVELEAFVHGALCVSYSGQCYASQHCFGRSANRGACAQFCRLPFSLVDADGRVVERSRHLLSLKDLALKDHLEELLSAGVTSLKIEGRLKDIVYVKNVTAAYSEALNAVVAKHPDRYCRASQGRCTYTFTPDLKKTFNRGFTTYFLNGRRPDIFSPDTPKALGECVGRVKEVRGRWLTVAGLVSFANGDGLCFFRKETSPDGHPRIVLEGFRVNRVEGNRLFPLRMPTDLRPGTTLYRNNDQALEHRLTRPSSERKVAASMTLEADAQGFTLTMAAGTRQVSVGLPMEKQQAQTPQHDNIERQLTKLGGTPYECSGVKLVPHDFPFFIPAGMLADLRRRAVEALMAAPLPELAPDDVPPSVPPVPYDARHPYLYNAANDRARDFYRQQGIANATAFETIPPRRDALIMQCRHCLRFAEGFCVRHGGRRPEWREPLSLVSDDGRRFRLEFDCHNCQMNVYAE